MAPPTTPPPFVFDHKKGEEIPTKHKEAIRQLHWEAKVPIGRLAIKYALNESTIRRVLEIKQSLHRRRKQPTTEAEMEAMVLEEWERIPQDWINELILKQEHWVQVLIERHRWSTPN